MQFCHTLGERNAVYTTHVTTMTTWMPTGGGPLIFYPSCRVAGIVMNPDKFQFTQREVDFAGFRISENRILPLPK